MYALLETVPYIALFAAIGIGVLIGKPSFKGISLGPVAGTLVAAVIIGQWHFDISGPFKSIMFALFIYSIGYMAGPSFVHAFSRKAWRQLVMATFIAVVALGTGLGLAYAYQLDLGTAVGFIAGAVTQSAIIGTAGGAIQGLNLPAATRSALDNNVAIAYSITYLFGTLGAILIVTYVTPLFSRQSLVAGAKALEQRAADDVADFEDGTFPEFRANVERTYTTSFGGKQNVSAVEKAIGPGVAVIQVLRAQAAMAMAGELMLAEGDEVLVEGPRKAIMQKAPTVIGPESSTLNGAMPVGETLKVVITKRALNHHTLAQCRDTLPDGSFHGVRVSGLIRAGQSMAILPVTELRTGDTVTLTGPKAATESLGKLMGYCEKPASGTDYVWMAGGIIAGILIGLVNVPVGAGVKIALGTGGGCMFSGLLFGYLRSLHPTFGQLPSSTAAFMKNFGLIAFIAVVGLAAGPKALETIQQHGWTLVYLGAIVTIVPIVAAQLLGAYVLRGDLKNSDLLAGSIAGGRSCTAALGSVMTVADSNAAMLTYPVPYTLAQVYLTLFGPVIVAIMSSWGPWAIAIVK
jgi:putative transport protein